MAEGGDVGPTEDEPKQYTVVLAGKREVGKSTLINNLLRLTGDGVAETALSANPTTTEVHIYRERVDKIKWKIVDTPGLGAGSQISQRNVMAQLIRKTDKKGDLLLYCVSIAPGGIINNTDEGILRLLSQVFGKGLFQHCILVLTMANVIEKEPTISKRAEGFVKNFQEALNKAAIPDIEVRAINTDKDYTGMLGIPAGSKDDDQILPNNKKWRETLLEEITKKINYAGPYPLEVKGYRKAMLMKYLGFSRIMDRIKPRKNSDTGPTKRTERANTKKGVQEQLVLTESSSQSKTESPSQSKTESPSQSKTGYSYSSLNVNETD